MTNVAMNNLPRKILICIQEMIFVTLVGLAITTVAGVTHYWQVQQAKTIIIGACSGMIGVFGTTIVEKLLKLKIGVAVDVCIALDLLLSVVLGEGAQVYLKVNGYDKFLHFIGTIQIALIGYIIAKYFLKKTNKGGSHHLAFSIIFAFFFALGIQMIWELYEFSFDMIAGTQMQKYLPDEFKYLVDPETGMLNATSEELAQFYSQFAGYHYAVEDTMFDVVADVCGSLTGVAGAAIVFHFYPQLQDSLLCDAKDVVEEVSIIEKKKKE